MSLHRIILRCLHSGDSVRLGGETATSVGLVCFHTAFFSNEPNLLSNIRRIDYLSVVIHLLITGRDDDNDVEE